MRLKKSGEYYQIVGITPIELSVLSDAIQERNTRLQDVGKAPLPAIEADCDIIGVHGFKYKDTAIEE